MARPGVSRGWHTGLGTREPADTRVPKRPGWRELCCTAATIALTARKVVQHAPEQARAGATEVTPTT
jgi:hypothetical protein